ncbi:ATP-grasp domain-containing protein [Oceanobacillus oncorhynchi]|uniref:ATP-grasp domain-containing protein n=1 Tax=Oceanobacillus oncorhynchi TaxID=545501 RepID=UPI001867B86F|nr:ATP-grasp domain-containing protein [Oceanobacillus oncorhynchi]
MPESRFLDSLNHPIPKRANNYMLSSYSMILEAWRRGLEVTVSIVKQKSGSAMPNYTIKSGDKEYHFNVTRGNIIPNKTIGKVVNKVATKEILEANNVPTPKGKEFNNEKDNNEVLAYANEIGYPLVVKPVDGTGGSGVIADIQNENELSEALEYVRGKLNYPDIILEEYFEGEDYRVYVLDSKVIGAIKRIKANLVGDGKSTIKELLMKKNEERIKLPSLSNRKIKVDDEVRTILKRKNLDLNSILPEGELLYIKSKNNVTAGGDSVDITDQLSDNIKQIAIDGANAFDSLVHCGVDIMVNEKEDIGKIIELNSRAHITQHLFPMKGQARDIPYHIINYYFPETKDYDRERAQKFYLDFDFIYDTCMNRLANNIKLPVLPTKGLEIKRFVIKNCTYSEKFAIRVRRLAYNTKVHGYIKSFDNGNISVVVGSSQLKIKEFRDALTKYVKTASKTGKIEEKPRSSPIMHGFHITSFDTNSKEGTLQKYTQDYTTLKSDYDDALKKLAKLEQDKQLLELTQKQNKQLKKKIDQMEESNSWRITKPIRAASEKFKR